MPWMLMACGGCGHTDDIDTFCKTTVYGDLPNNTYQCPSCKLAIERRVSGKGVRYPSGLYVPDPVELVQVSPKL